MSMSMCPVFSSGERQKLGVLINNLSVFASQLLAHSGTDFSARALRNLATVRKEQPRLIERLDELARNQNEEIPSRLIEDLARVPSDLAQAMSLIRRCLLASAFLAHCIAQPAEEQGGTRESTGERQRLH